MLSINHSLTQMDAPPQVGTAVVCLRRHKASKPGQKPVPGEELTASMGIISPSMRISSPDRSPEKRRRRPSFSIPIYPRFHTLASPLGGSAGDERLWGVPRTPTPVLSGREVVRTPQRALTLGGGPDLAPGDFRALYLQSAPLTANLELPEPPARQRTSVNALAPRGITLRIEKGRGGSNESSPEPRTSEGGGSHPIPAEEESAGVWGARAVGFGARRGGSARGEEEGAGVGSAKAVGFGARRGGRAKRAPPPRAAQTRHASLRVALPLKPRISPAGLEHQEWGQAPSLRWAGVAAGGAAGGGGAQGAGGARDAIEGVSGPETPGRRAPPGNNTPSETPGSANASTWVRSAYLEPFSPLSQQSAKLPRTPQSGRLGRGKEGNSDGYLC